MFYELDDGRPFSPSQQQNKVAKLQVGAENEIFISDISIGATHFRYSSVWSTATDQSNSV